MRILYVDDDPRLLGMGVSALSDDGHDVEEAVDCLAGWHVINAAHRPFDLLITDIETPGSIDGWELAALARARSPAISVIYATGASLDLARPVANGIILPKPFTQMALQHCVRRQAAPAIVRRHSEYPPSTVQPGSASRPIAPLHDIPPDLFLVWMHEHRRSLGMG